MITFEVGDRVKTAYANVPYFLGVVREMVQDAVGQRLYYVEWDGFAYEDDRFYVWHELNMDEAYQDFKDKIKDRML